MGTSYQRWLIARGNVFLPSATAVAKVVEDLRAAGFIVDPSSGPAFEKLHFTGARESHAKKTGGYAVRTVDKTFGDVHAMIAATTEPQPATMTADWLDDPDREELRLVWPVSYSRDAGLRYPLSMKPDNDEVAYALEVHRAPEYVYPIADTIGRLPTTCACGEELDFEWDEEEVVPAFPSSTGIFAECDACSRTFDPSKGMAKIKNPFDGTSERVPGGAAYRFAVKVTCERAFVHDARLAFSSELVAVVEKTFGRQFYEVGALSKS